MKILHIAETSMGGVGTYLNQILPRQSAEFGSDCVRLIAPAEHAVQMDEVSTRQAVYFSRPCRSVGSLLRLAAEILRTVKEFQPDIIHAHSTFAGALVRIMFGWRHERPVLVYCPHGWAFNIQAARWKLFAVALAERLMAPFCDRIIAISNHEAKEAMRIGIDPAKIEVIRNAIPLTAPAPAPVTWPDTRRKILFIGRLDRQKGFDILAEAVAGLEQDFVVRVAGAAVTSSACASGAPHIEFLGWLTPAGIEGHLRCADLVVMPSRWEGFGLTALEAMRAGKPVIAAAVGGLPEVVVSGVTGRLVPPGDANALRHALRALDAKALNRMGEQGQKYFRREFTIDRMHQSLVDLYTNLAAPRIRAGWPAVQS